MQTRDPVPFPVGRVASGDGVSPAPPNDDAAEYRAYLQRGETRLSTFQRVAGAFLGGAGLLTLLPVLFRDTFSVLFSRLLFLETIDVPGANSVQRWLLAIPISLSLLMPLAALFFLIRDLVEFYFTGHHFRTGDKDAGGTTYPRFILSGILVAIDNDDMTRARNDGSVVELLVPRSEVARERLFREAETLNEANGMSFGTFKAMRPADQDEWLKNFLNNYTASLHRTLPLESAKMEASLARHHVLLRILVLRYAKAFLLTILTMCTTILGVVVLDLLDPQEWQSLTANGRPAIPSTIAWCGVIAVCAAWCLAAAWVVRLPVVWINEQYGDKNAKMETPQSLLEFERLTLGAAFAGAVASGTSLWWFALDVRQPTVYWLAALITGLAVTTIVYVLRVRR